MYININRMTKFYRSLCIFLFSLAIFSCSDDDPFPAPMVNFAIDTPPVEVGVPVMFDNLSTNAARYEWDFGDGQVVDDISPEVTFTSAGNVTVTLRAYTEDNQVDSTSQTFRVHERVVTGYIINVFPASNGAEAWDPGEAGANQLADIVIQVVPDDPNNETGFVDGIFTNQIAGPIGRNLDPGNRVVLSDEDFTVILFDFDQITADDGVQPEELSAMIGAQFNPITEVPATKNDAGDAGWISVYTEDQNVGALDVDIFFELQ